MKEVKRSVMLTVLVDFLILFISAVFCNYLLKTKESVFGVFLVALVTAGVVYLWGQRPSK